jgi:hypothetical protein
VHAARTISGVLDGEDAATSVSRARPLLLHDLALSLVRPIGKVYAVDDAFFRCWLSEEEGATADHLRALLEGGEGRRGCVAARVVDLP